MQHNTTSGEQFLHLTKSNEVWQHIVIYVILASFIAF